MKSRGMWVSLMLVSVGCTAETSEATDAAGGPSFAASDSMEIVALYDRLEAAARANDWDTWGAQYTSDAVRMPPNASVVEGQVAMDAFNDATPPVTQFELVIASLTGRPDLAVARGRFTMATAASGPTVPATDEEGKFMTMLTRQSDGSWKIASDIWNSDKPVP